MEIDGTTIVINGDLTIEANASGGSSNDGAGGTGTGGEAYIGVINPSVPGTLTVGGHTLLSANGEGGSTFTGFPAGDGIGGFAWIQVQGGGSKTFGSLQVSAMGFGGTAQSHEGGDGIGGDVLLRSSGADSRLTILRNVPASIAAESPAGIAMLNASGIGAAAFGGNGIGGVGQGGTIELDVSLGGAINLPVDMFSDPDRVADSLFFLADGFGGDSAVEGGAGGEAFGGTASILVDGGTLVSGEAIVSTFAQGGSSLDAALNITGGNASGGTRSIRVVNGGTLTLETSGGSAGALGGDGSGTGNGGDAVAGTVLFEVLDSVANLAGRFSLNNGSRGGGGQRGGDAGGGSITVSTDNAQINLSTGISGPGSLSLAGEMMGGTGVAVGGNADGTAIGVTLAGTTLGGGALTLGSLAIGGAASAADGTGGDATGSAVQFATANATLTLEGALVISADALGGTGGADGQGGAATAGNADVTLTDSSLTLVPGDNEPPALLAQSSSLPTNASALLAISANADGGLGGTAGSSTGARASLSLTNASVDVDEVVVQSRATSFGFSGQTGGASVGGDAMIALTGTSSLDALNITIDADAVTDLGGTARGGTASLELAAGSAAAINADLLRMTAVATGGDPGSDANVAGQFIADIGGGNVNLGRLEAAALGDSTTGSPPASQLAADGGNLNVAGEIAADVSGDLVVRTGQGGIIGSAATTGNVTAVSLFAGGNIQVLGDGSAGGLAGQTISLEAGRSILLGGDLTARGGPIDLTANLGGGQVLSSPPPSVITMAQGSRIDAGTGTVTIRLLDGAGDPQRVNGAITLASISASSIDVRNFGTSAGSDITVLSDGVLTASASGRAIDLAALNGEVNNLAGDAGLVLTGGGHYGIFAATPTGSQIGSFANYARRYNVADEGAYDALNPGGNFAAFRLAPVLTVTADDFSRFYGSANPLFTASFAGFQPGDGVANLTGTPQFTTLATGTSNVGTFAINVALGSLLSEQGYQFTFAPGLLTVTPRPITVFADNLTRVYGNANPALTFTVGGEGLVNGDQLTGALATIADATTGVGTVAITRGTLAASTNYALTFVNGQLTITPRPITLIADNLSKMLGMVDPALTFTLSGDGLVNGDQLSGSLVRDPGERAGNFAIRQGTLGAGPNYVTTFVGGVLTINGPPAPPEITNPAIFQGAITIDATPPGAEGEEDERFGMDFSERPDAPLIAEDPLLDDPVASGSDAALYGSRGADVPPEGEK